MEKHVRNQRQGDREVKRTVVLVDEPSPTGTEFVRARQMHLLREMVENPRLLSVGAEMFQEMRMYHSGKEWVIELVSIVEG